MALIETLALTFVTSVAKQMLSQWLGSNWAAGATEDVVGLLRDAAIDKAVSKSDREKTDAIAAGVVRELDQWAKVELTSLDKAEKRLAIEGVAFTLASSGIDAKMLVDLRLDSEYLRKYLVECRPDATRSFSGKATSFYERLIKESAARIVEHVAEIPGFLAAFSKASLDGDDQIAEILRQQSKQYKAKVREFERRYREAVVRRLDRMELFGLPRMDEIARQQSLSIAYVRIALAPSFDIGWNRWQFEYRMLAHFLRIREATGGNVPSLSIAEETTGTPDGLVSDAIDTGTTGTFGTDAAWDWIAGRKELMGLVVQGRAGSGKTTLLQWQAIRLAKQGLNQSSETGSALVPFFLRLREFVDTGFPVPDDFVRLIAPMVAGEMPSGWVHDVLKDKRAALLIDGMDEVPLRSRTDMLQNLKDLMDTFPGNFCAITSRPAAISSVSWPGWASWVRSNKFIEFELLDMTPNQVDGLISNWHLALATTLDDQMEQEKVIASGESLIRQLRRRPEIRRLTVNPLLCAMVCAVHHERAENLPSERATLYKDCVDILLNRRDPGRKIKAAIDYPDLGETQKERLVESIAYWMIRNGFSDATVEDVDLHFSSLLKRMNVCDDCGSAVRRFFVERSSLLREPVIGRIDFPHRTLQEYLAGKAAVEENDFGMLLEHALDDQWRETIIMAVGAARHTERSKFLRDLIAKADSQSDLAQRSHLYLLAISCLETPGELDPDVRHVILDRAITSVPPQSTEQVQIISKAGNPVVQLLEPNPDYSSEEAANCVETLAQIGSDIAMRSIASYVSDSRPAVVGAIGYAWNSFDSKLYFETVLQHSKSIVLNNAPRAALIARLSNVKELKLYVRRPSEIASLKELENLRELTLSLHKQALTSTSLNPLGKLSQLRALHLEVTASHVNPVLGVEDLRVSLAFLWHLRNLEFLELSSLGSVDLLPLIDLSMLKSLHLSHCQLRSVSQLSELKRLHTLGLDNHLIRQPGLTRAIRHIRDLHIPGLGDNSAFDCAVLAPLAAIRSLTVKNHQKLVNLSTLTQFRDLVELDIDVNPDRLPPLENLITLRIAGIRSGASMERLLYFGTLQNLAIAGSEPVDMRLFDHMDNLKSVDLSGCTLRSLAAMSELPGLTTIVLSSHQAMKLKTLVAKLPALKRVIIRGPGRIDRASLQDRNDIVVERL